MLYLLLTVAVVAGYAVLVATFDVLLRGWGAPVLATLLIALTFNPARVWLQHAVDRLLYGARSDPVEAVSQVGARLAADDLAGVLEGVREALRLPFASLRQNDREVAAAGTPFRVLHSIALTFQGERVGELVIGVRKGEHELGKADLAVLGLLAGPLAVALHATALASTLPQHRQRGLLKNSEATSGQLSPMYDALSTACVHPSWMNSA